MDQPPNLYSGTLGSPEHVGRVPIHFHQPDVEKTAIEPAVSRILRRPLPELFPDDRSRIRRHRYGRNCAPSSLLSICGSGRRKGRLYRRQTPPDSDCVTATPPPPTTVPLRSPNPTVGLLIRHHHRVPDDESSLYLPWFARSGERPVAGGGRSSGDLRRTFSDLGKKIP